MPVDHPDRSHGLTNFAVDLITHFEQLGELSDLQEAITLHRQALSLRPVGHSDRSLSLSNLANALGTYFEQLGKLPDLEEAILLHREALSLRPVGHPDHPASLNNLANALSTHFDTLGEMTDLEEAITLNREALSLTPAGDPGKMADLEEAITLHREALHLCPVGHPDRSLSLNNLASALTMQFEQLGEMTNVEEAIMLSREALYMCPVGHPNHSLSLNNLANALSTLFEHRGELSDLEEAIILHKEALSFDYIHADITSRLKHTSDWAIAAHQHKHQSTTTAYKKALELLEQCLIIRPTLELQHNFFQTVQSTSTLTSNAVSWAIEIAQLHSAVQLWEQGRGILWSKMKDYRSPIGQLKIQDAALAEQFENVTQQLEQSSTRSSKSQSSSQQESKWAAKRALNDRWTDLVKKIQSMPGFETFLKAPPFSSIAKVASEGPVILVNLSSDHSDALILYSVDSDPICVPLPDVKHVTVFENINVLSESLKLGYLAHDSHQAQLVTRENACMDLVIEHILKQLWICIASPVLMKLDDLGFGKGSRIWWCPSGKLCTLPLHAAQPFEMHTHPQQQLSKKYVQSYTPTLGSLIRARKDVVARVDGNAPDILAIATSSLNKVYEEINVMQTVGCKAEELVGDKVTHDTMLEGLPKYPWIHFASHGHIDTKQPFNSSFELHDNARLTILDLVKANLPNAELAILSACHTAAVDKDNTPDEGISLAAGMQFCGFRGIVGTLWAMDDEDGPLLAQEFYKRILHPKAKPVDFKDAAKVLKAVTNEMRRQNVPLHRWVPFVHIGA
ncbi:TPR-like protein [Auriscalpium vulgare]|uniref:TPR-like protein n=1 Tax=Auriscalpium vulgare TaxID=40419 RepID=A0ACB8RED2_9AGAM|nr:TPR-like protein [Auriscalpium vulgare]